MKKVLFYILTAALLSSSSTVWAQSSAPIEYSERVPVDNTNKGSLYRRGLDWAQNHFAYTPTSEFKTDPSTGSIRVIGTSKVKPVNAAGKDQISIVRFEFIFNCTSQGYTYSVGSFRYVPDPKKNPNQTISLDEYLSELAADKNIDKSHNDRRVAAQANALASEIAMNFRSFMNTIPTIEDGSVGLPANSGE
ncbi:DUF4468 domain-containing protein [Hymenobacter sp. BT175]|uniref:DUF4468 domain-containing protein n=1 Tax=Hymenobacter translucens TaxID=2886507 RepID=UPI001D0E1FF7|nr:DUF4468 domain-containing protein [Hymenobacter translucens]MCC2547334.1 DUF4468 domain-containing protein [Hymenobacter translucens]